MYRIIVKFDDWDGWKEPQFPCVSSNPDELVIKAERLSDVYPGVKIVNHIGEVFAYYKKEELM